MNRLIKRTICFSIISVLMFSSIFPLFANAESADGGNQSRTKLLEIGVPEEFLNYITEDAMKKILEFASDNEITDIKLGTGESQAAKVGPNDGVGLNKNITAKTLTMKYKDKQTKEFMGEVVAVYWEWKKGKPLVKQEDYVQIDVDNSSLVFDGSYYAENYLVKSKGIQVTENFETPAHVENPQYIGLGNYTKLHNGGQNAGAVVFNLAAKELGADEGTDNVYITYAHYYGTTVLVLVLIFAILLLIVLVLVLKKRKKTKKIAKPVEEADSPAEPQ